MKKNRGRRSLFHMFTQIGLKFSARAREKRALTFKQHFYLDEQTRILDLGSATGENIHTILHDTSVRPENVYIADIIPAQLDQGSKTFGFTPVLIEEMGKLPFEDHFFDIVYCSSVIEHVTVPKHAVWHMASGRQFRAEAWRNQCKFAADIQRVGQHYFVQTPDRLFPIESHSWLPCMAWLPRRLLLPVLRFTNLFWVKTTMPDWNILSQKDMTTLFRGAKIVIERYWGIPKSIMAISTNRSDESGHPEPNKKKFREEHSGNASNHPPERGCGPVPGE